MHVAKTIVSFFQNLVICLVIHTIVLSAVAQTATRHDPFFGNKVESKRKPNEGVGVAKLSTGPFAVRAIETPRVANTAGGRESRNINLAGDSKAGLIFEHLFYPFSYRSAIWHRWGSYSK